jgi:hypothetical protein
MIGFASFVSAGEVGDEKQERGYCSSAILGAE